MVRQLDPTEMVSGMVDDTLDDMLARIRFIGKRQDGSPQGDERQYRLMARYIALVERGIRRLKRTIICDAIMEGADKGSLALGLGISKQSLYGRYGEAVRYMKAHPDRFVETVLNAPDATVREGIPMRGQRREPWTSDEQDAYVERFKRDFLDHPSNAAIARAIAERIAPANVLEEAVADVCVGVGGMSDGLTDDDAPQLASEESEPVADMPEERPSVLDEPTVGGAYLTADASPYVAYRNGGGRWTVVDMNGERLHDADGAAVFGWRSVVSILAASAFPLTPLMAE